MQRCIGAMVLLMVAGPAAPAGAQPSAAAAPRDFLLSASLGGSAVHLGDAPGFHYGQNAPAMDASFGLRYELTPRLSLCLLEFRGTAAWLEHEGTRRSRTLGLYALGVGGVFSPLPRLLHLGLVAGPVFAGWAHPKHPDDPLRDEEIDSFTASGVGLSGTLAYDLAFFGPAAVGVQARVAYDRLLTDTDASLPRDQLLVSVAVTLTLDLRHFFRVARRSPAP